METNVRITDDAEQSRPVVLELGDGQTKVTVRMSLDELNDLSTEAAEELNGHRGDILGIDS